jgi:hypothetical protein
MDGFAIILEGVWGLKVLGALVNRPVLIGRVEGEGRKGMKSSTSKKQFMAALTERRVRGSGGHHALCPTCWQPRSASNLFLCSSYQKVSVTYLVFNETDYPV